jgi:NADH-quinone oxidoreductase subunit H
VFVVSAVAVTLFWGGWLRPFPNVSWLAIPFNYGVPAALFLGSALLSFRLAPRLVSGPQKIGLIGFGAVLVLIAAIFLVPFVNNAIIGLFWFLFKVALIIYMMIWFRGTFPRFRYDQLMNIGWKVMIPIGMGAVLVNAILGMARA